MTTKRAMFEEDWSFCRESLERHSRTFAIPIRMLPALLDRAVTCSYLLCRIADTVEDTPDWDTPTKSQLYRLLQDAVDGQLAAQDFASAVQSTPGGDPAERTLLMGLGRVLSVFGELPDGLQRVCRERVVELIGGMMIYSRRRAGSDGIRCLESTADLDRYCYFVAGVIGRLLTDAFLHELPMIDEAAARAMRTHAEQFGAGLQLVNILRDLSADLQRGVCFVPRSSFERAQLAPAELCNPQYRRQARAMLDELFTKARAHLLAAFEYALAIPASSVQIRNFCLVPLWLAVATLQQCASDQRLLQSGETVKLSRQRVMELIEQCVRCAADDEGLRASFTRLNEFAV
ncbi:MAG TPA: squalene/phytoene synthase family protein [Polyangiaceae bacterium]|nr:squalene/phytoene synthase family protein [Polyangiaceae bacterium]